MANRQSKSPIVQSWLILAFALLAAPSHCVAQSAAPGDLQWISVKDQRLQWLNVADWELKGGPSDPVVPCGRAIAQRIKGTLGITG